MADLLAIIFPNCRRRDNVVVMSFDEAGCVAYHALWYSRKTPLRWTCSSAATEALVLLVAVTSGRTELEPTRATATTPAARIEPITAKVLLIQ
jgi:hypothetical protein